VDYGGITQALLDFAWQNNRFCHDKDHVDVNKYVENHGILHDQSIPRNIYLLEKYKIVYIMKGLTE